MYKLALLLSLVFSAIAPVANATSTPSPDDGAIRQAFSDYRKSVVTNDGSAALGLVSSDTIDYYNAILKLALHAPSTIVRQANIGDRILILMVRHRLPVEQLKAMDGGQLFVHAVNNGWIGKNGVDRLDVGPVAVRGNTARAVMIAQGKTSPIHVTMRREGNWRIDLTSILPVTNRLFSAAANRLGFSEDDFVMITLDSLSSRTVPDTIWEPVIQ